MIEKMGLWHLRDGAGVVWNHPDKSTLLNFVFCRNRIAGRAASFETPWLESKRDFGHRADVLLGQRRYAVA